jgi:hypothetical protein
VAIGSFANWLLPATVLNLQCITFPLHPGAAKALHT